MPSGVYRITNLKNGKSYIGSSKDIDYRWYNHRSYLRGGKHENANLQEDWNYFGERVFYFEIMEYVDDLEKLIEREQAFIDLLKPDYNIAPNAGSTTGMRKGKRGFPKADPSIPPGQKWEALFGKEKADHHKEEHRKQNNLEKYTEFRKGKTIEELYGPVKAAQVRIASSIAHKGTHTNHGGGWKPGQPQPPHGPMPPRPKKMSPIKAAASKRVAARRAAILTSRVLLKKDVTEREEGTDGK